MYAEREDGREADEKEAACSHGREENQDDN